MGGSNLLPEIALINILGQYGNGNIIIELKAHESSPDLVAVEANGGDTSINGIYFPNFSQGLLIRTSLNQQNLGMSFAGEVGSSAVTGIITSGTLFQRTLSIRSTYIGPKYIIKGPFIGWWGDKEDFSSFISESLEYLIEVRNQAWAYGMVDPPSIRDGYFQNIYFWSHFDDPKLPGHLGNGVGTDSNGYPFWGTHGDTDPSFAKGNAFHEGLHLLQYSSANELVPSASPGYAYDGNSAWFIEASANWIASINEPENIFSLTIGTIHAVPQLALWRSFNFFHPDLPENAPETWNREVHQYHMNTLLHFLTEVENVPRAYITDGFYAGTNKSPQEYIHNRIGGAQFRKFFINWCAHNAAFYDYITREQYEYSLWEIDPATNIPNLDPNDINPYVQTFADTGTNGVFIEPSQNLRPMGWAYNVYRITISRDAEYTFTIEGDQFGSEGQASMLASRIALANRNDLTKNYFLPIQLSRGLNGEGRVSVSAVDITDVFLVVATVPESFDSFQTYSYKIKIDRTESSTSSPTSPPTREPTLPPTAAPTSAPTPEDCTEYQLDILTDGYPEETTWTIENSRSDIVASGGRYYEKNTLFTSKGCLKNGEDFKLTVNDSYGDGICCSQGNGEYIFYIGGKLIARGGNFKYAQSLNFVPTKVLELSLETDNYGSDTSWIVIDCSGEQVMVGSSYGNNENIYESMFVPNGGTFTINDSYGDGKFSFVESERIHSIFPILNKKVPIKAHDLFKFPKIMIYF